MNRHKDPSRARAVRSIFTEYAVAAFCVVGTTAAAQPFDSPSLYTLFNGQPLRVDVCDLDQDGWNDLIATESGEDRIAILYNDGIGLGALEPAVHVDTGTSPIGLRCLDYDGDGDVDVVCTNFEDTYLSLIRNDGNRVLTHVSLDYGIVSFARDIVGIDINTDGILDLVTVSEMLAGPDQITVFTGNASGEFSLPEFIELGGLDPWAVTGADLNGDQIPDLAVAARTSDAIIVRLGEANGTLGAPLSLATGNGPQDLVACDIDNDGDQDLVVSCVFDGTVGLLRGDGTGLFGAFETVGAAPNAEAVACYDVDRNGWLDMIVGSGNNAVVFRSNGQNGFLPPETLSSGAVDIVDVAVANLNSDCAPDLIMVALVSNQISVRRNGGPPFSLAPAEIYGSGPFIGRLTVAEIGTSGLPDVVAVDIGNGSAQIYYMLNNGSGGLTVTAAGIPGCSQIGDIAAADVDSDGDTDLLVTCRINSGLHVYLNDGSGGMTAAAVVSGGARKDTVACDIDGDGDLDAIGVDDTGDRLYQYVNDGLGNFSSPQQFAVAGTPLELACVDFDFDGDFDVAVTKSAGADGILVFNNQGGGTFTELYLATANGSAGLAACDLNGDQLPDLVQANGSGLSVSINLGGGSFTEPVSTNDQARSVVGCCDVDGDGDNDLVVNHTNARLAAYLNNGQGAFQMASAVYPMGGVNDVSCADLDGNGSLDVVTANVSVYRRANLVIPSLRIVSVPFGGIRRVGDPLELSVGVEGSGQVRYQWYKDLTLLLGESSSTLQVSEVTFTDAGYYSVGVSGDCSDILTQPVFIAVFERADVDADGDVDRDDFVRFVECLGGPLDVLPGPPCGARQFDGADVDDNGTVDLRDFRVFQMLFADL